MAQICSVSGMMAKVRIPSAGGGNIEFESDMGRTVRSVRLRGHHRSNSSTCARTGSFQRAGRGFLANPFLSYRRRPGYWFRPVFGLAIVQPREAPLTKKE